MDEFRILRVILISINVKNEFLTNYLSYIVKYSNG